MLPIIQMLLHFHFLSHSLGYSFPKDYYLDEGNVSFVLITRHHNICFKLPVVVLQHSNVRHFKKDVAGFSDEVFC